MVGCSKQRVPDAIATLTELDRAIRSQRHSQHPDRVDDEAATHGVPISDRYPT